MINVEYFFMFPTLVFHGSIVASHSCTAGSTGSKKTMPKITMPTAVKQKF